jgi:F420-0:gamma-glutamyl ligase
MSSVEAVVDELSAMSSVFVGETNAGLSVMVMR